MPCLWICQWQDTDHYEWPWVFVVFFPDAEWNGWNGGEVVI